MEKLNLAVLPAGAWGAAFSRVAAEAGHDVSLYFRSEADGLTFANHHLYPKKLRGIIFPEEIKVAECVEQALIGADCVVLAPPSRFLRDFYRTIKTYIPGGASILCLTKGLEQETNLRMSQVLEEEEPGISQRLAILSGPNLAHEIARGLPAAAVVASSNFSLAERMQNFFNTRRFRIYTQDDVLGVELGGACKNVIAIAAGVNDGLEMGENARAALINRGLSEIIRLAVCMGAREQTLRGLSGEGDLWLTCASSQSRNHQAGVEIAKGADPAELANYGRTVEGFYAVTAMISLARKYNVPVPIAQAVYEVLHEGVSINEAIRKLVERAYVHENGLPLKSTL